MRVYYGWFIVAAALIILTLVMGATFLSFGVFISPISQELGLSRAEANTSFILFALGGAAFAPIIGKLMDRWPIRPVILACAVAFGASLALLGLSHSTLLSAFLLAVPLAIATQGSVISANALVTRWFTVHRGRAMAIAQFGMSLAGILMTPAIAFGVEHMQWRQTLIVLGIALTLLLLAVAMIIREKPGPNDIESAQPQAADANVTMQTGEPLKAASILLMPQFWTIGLSTALTLSLAGAVTLTLVPLGEATGASPTAAATLISVLSAAGFAGGLLTAWIADRIDRVLLLAGLYLAVAGAGALYYFGVNFAVLVVATTAFGIASGSASAAYLTVLADRFGAASFGTVFGLLTVLMTVFNSGFAWVAGAVFDRTGSYSVLFLGIVVLEIIAALLMFSTRALGRPAAGAAAH